MNKKYTGIGAILVVIVLIVGCKGNANKELEITNDNNSTQLVNEGKEITSTSFIALSTELQKAMKSGGIGHALAYCNINALAITDSLSNVFDVEIKRTSLKFRNSKNAPTKEEKEMLTQFEISKKRGELIAPQVVGNIFYAPIIVQDMCLKCHGRKDDIVNYDMINNLYPDDQAYGYIQGDLRGMWKVKFKEN